MCTQQKQKMSNRKKFPLDSNFPTGQANVHYRGGQKFLTTEGNLLSPWDKTITADDGLKGQTTSNRCKDLDSIPRFQI